MTVMASKLPFWRTKRNGTNHAIENSTAQSYTVQKRGNLPHQSVTQTLLLPRSTPVKVTVMKYKQEMSVFSVMTSQHLRERHQRFVWTAGYGSVR